MHDTKYKAYIPENKNFLKLICIDCDVGLRPPRNDSLKKRHPEEHLKNATSGSIFNCHSEERSDVGVHSL